jgi:hypothetical protein
MNKVIIVREIVSKMELRVRFLETPIRLPSVMLLSWKKDLVDCNNIVW